MSSITISYDAAHAQPDSIVFNARPYSKTVIEPEQLSADQFFEVFVLNEDDSDLAESGPEYIIFNFAVYCKQNTDPADIADGVLRVSFPIYSNVQTEDASVVWRNFASQSNLAFQPNLVFQPNLTFQPNFAFHTSPASYPQQGNGLPPHQQAYGQQNQPPYPSKPPHNQQQSYGNQNSQSNIAYQPNVIYQPQLTFQPNFAFHAPQPNPTAQAGATSTAPGLSLPRTTLLNANYIPRPQGVQKKALVFGFDLPPHLRNTVQLNAPTLNYASDPSAQTNGTAVKRQRQRIIWAEADSKYFFQLIELALLTLGRRLQQFDFKAIAEALNRNFRGSTVYGNHPYPERGYNNLHSRVTNHCCWKTLVEYEHLVTKVLGTPLAIPIRRARFTNSGDGDDNDDGNVPGGQEQAAGPSGQYGQPPYAPPQQAYGQYPGSQQYPANVPDGYGQYPDPSYQSF